MIDKNLVFVERNVGRLSLDVKHKMPADVVVEDILWNSLDGNVSKQRGEDNSLQDLLPQKGQIGGIRVQL
jgi:hypothetical protein